MWQYEKKLQYPIRIKNTNPAMAKYIITQYGGPDGELAASLRYLSQRFAMPYPEVKAILTDIGISGAILHLPETGCPELGKRFEIKMTKRTAMRYSRFNGYSVSGTAFEVNTGRFYRKIVLAVCAKERY